MSLLLLAVSGLLALTAYLTNERPAQAQLLSPGPLAEAHASLEGDSHCVDCHSGGKRVEAAKCLDCHKELKARVEAKKGLHGTAYLGQDCGPCHVDHIGKNAHLVRWPEGGQSKFDHKLTGWTLTGKHTDVECAKCHDKKTEKGSATFLGLSTACVSCHKAKDPHEGRLGDKCDTCHETGDWKKLTLPETGFDHSKTRFPLRGAHGQVKCKECHGEPPKYTGLAFNQCSDCHKDPHGGKFKQTCSSCHTEKSWKEIGKGKFEHPGLSLANGHAKVACAKCHDKGDDKDPSKGKTCVACHPVVHKAAFGNDCKKCHADILWLGIPRQISLDAHVSTQYPLKGKHVAVACDACHDPKKKADARFRQLKFDRCGVCHADKHKGEFAQRALGECGQCHTDDGFVPTTFGPTQHATTKFALDGRHRAVGCAKCHTAPPPRLDWRNPKSACADCHANPHGDQFAAEMAKGGCAQCHTANGWGVVKIDHSTFPLLGAHARAECSGCHDPSPEDKRAGKGASWKGVPRQCEACHTDEHGGQFATASATAAAKGCADCHGNEAFKIPGFDHLEKTGYALDGKHAAVECAKCHPTARRKDGVLSVRWRLGYRRCRDCHADPHGE